MSKPKATSSLNPWEALFSSVSRPQASVVSHGCRADDGGVSDTKSTKTTSSSAAAISASSAGGYTILIQHSLTPKSQRQWALASTMAETTERSRSVKGATSLQSSMSSMTLTNKSPSKHTFQGSWYGMSGPFLVRQAFEELCHRCDGAVVFVSTLGTNGVLDIDELDGSSFNDSNYDEREYSDGNGDDEEYDTDQRKKTQPGKRKRDAVQLFRRNGACVDLSSDSYGWEDDTDDHVCDSFVQSSTMSKLQSISLAIRRAASNVESQRTASRGQENSKKEQKKMQRPIPIVFESLTPLLHLHGVEKISLLLKSLGVSSSSIAVPGIQPILSPIIAPILYESLRPSEHRCLEDMADAMVHLNLVNAAGYASDSTSNDSNSKVISSGVMDVVRRGGGGRGGLGGKLMRNCVPFCIMRANISNGTYPVDTRDTCYWILDHDSTNDTDGNDNKQQEEGIQSIQISDQPATSTTGPTRPRIYLEDDDPEFDDFDEEEELDDDLDF